MKVIFLDGESKGGKTAVGRAIRDALMANGHNVRLVVAGNFFRHVTWLALKGRPEQPVGHSWLEPAVHAALDSSELYGAVPDTSELEKTDVEELVSTVGELGFVQHAVAAWREAVAQKALDDGVEILIFDGRNLRIKLHNWLMKASVPVALELNIFCRPEVAGVRRLADEGVVSPTAEQLEAATQNVVTRRQRDRERDHAAYVDPINPVQLVVGTHSVDEALAAAFGPDVTDPPRSIRFDNSEVPRDDGLRTVTELAVKAVQLN